MFVEKKPKETAIIPCFDLNRVSIIITVIRRPNRTTMFNRCINIEKSFFNDIELYQAGDSFSKQLYRYKQGDHKGQSNNGISLLTTRTHRLIYLIMNHDRKQLYHILWVRLFSLVF